MWIDIIVALGIVSTSFVLIPMVVVFFEVTAAMVFSASASNRTNKARVASPSIVVLVPAHNEEKGIASTIESIKASLPLNGRILCVAHNCSDLTAQVARRYGTEVIEVNQASSGGKPDAIKAGLCALDANPPDIVVIIDADCKVSKGAISALASKAYQLNRPVMGAYFIGTQQKGGKSSVSDLAVLLKNYIRPLGLYALRQPCLLNGSGSAYPFHLVRNVPHGEGSIAEDYQLTVDLLRQGFPTYFLPEAEIYSELPTQARAAYGQRKRWEHGQMRLAFCTAPWLFIEGLFKLNLNRCAIALELSVPPLIFLVLMWAMVVLLNLLAFFVHGQILPLIALLAGGTLFTSSVFAGWFRFAGSQKTKQALFAIPHYLFWKLPLYRDYFTHRETRWIRTERDA